MNIAQSKTRDQFPLSQKKIIKKTLARTLFITILLTVIWIITAIALVTTSHAGAAFAVSLGFLAFIGLIVGLTYLYQRWYFAVYFYDLTPDYIVIRKGPITPKEITIPYERIQDVYVDQDLLDRMMGLYDVHLSSATISSGMSAHIDGVEKAAADGLRENLLKTVNERISRRRVPVPPAPQAGE